MIDAAGHVGRARLHRHALALRPLLLRVPVGGVEGAAGRDDRGRRDVLVLPGAACGRGSARSSRAGRAASARSLDLRWETFAQYLDALRAVRPSRERRSTSSVTARSASRRMGFEARPAGGRRSACDGAAARRGHGRRRLRLLDRPRVRAERLLRDRRSWSRSPARWRRAAATTSRTSAASPRCSIDSINEAIRIGEEAGSACRSPTSRPRAARTGRRSTPRSA